MPLRPMLLTDLHGDEALHGLADRHVPGVLEVTGPVATPLPILFDSPHSGEEWPADFAPALERYFVDRACDHFVDELVAAAPAHGITLVKALFPRTYIDANRAEHELDAELVDGTFTGPVIPSEKSKLGKGLIWRLGGNGQEVYDRRLSIAEIESRIHGYYRPYHAKISEVHALLEARFGQVWHINCHSMKSVVTAKEPRTGVEKRADIVVSDLDGAAADQALVGAIVEWFRAQGLNVAVNDPFKGAEILRRYGQPKNGRHAVQIEVNRALYMDEIKLIPHTQFHQMRDILDRFCGFLAALVTQSLQVR